MSRVTDLLGEAPSRHRVKSRDEQAGARAQLTLILHAMPDYAGADDPLNEVLVELVGYCWMTQSRCARVIQLRFGVPVSAGSIGVWIRLTPGLQEQIDKAREKSVSNLERRKRALGGDGRGDWKYWYEKAARNPRQSRKARERYKSLMRGTPPG